MSKLDQIQDALDTLNNTPIEELYTDDFWDNVQNNLKNEQEKRKESPDYNHLRGY